MLEINFQPFPEITTERLHLRQITINDKNDIYLLRSNTIVMKYLDRPSMKNLNEALDLIKKVQKSEKENNAILWGISIKNESKLIGTIGFWQITKEHYRAEIGYMLHSDFHRKGIMQEAIEEVINFGFDQLNLHTIKAVVNPKNKGSIGLLEKNKFKREAYFTENYYYDGKFLDIGVYSLVKHWWK